MRVDEQYWSLQETGVPVGSGASTLRGPIMNTINSHNASHPLRQSARPRIFCNWLRVALLECRSEEKTRRWRRASSVPPSCPANRTTRSAAARAHIIVPPIGILAGSLGSANEQSLVRCAWGAGVHVRKARFARTRSREGGKARRAAR